MKKRIQFRTSHLLAVMTLIAVLLPSFVAHGPSIARRIFPGMFETKTVTASQVIPQLLVRVNPSSSKEIMIRPLPDDRVEVTFRK